MMPLLNEGLLIVALVVVVLFGACLFLIAWRNGRYRAAGEEQASPSAERDVPPGILLVYPVEASPPQQSALAGPPPAISFAHAPIALTDVSGPLASEVTRELPVTIPRVGRWLAILVAEDNPVNRTMALRQLERLGYRADAVTNGREAVAAASSRSYDLILMDMLMPELNGDQATRAIRSLGDAIRQPYIIALTANAMDGDRERCLQAGMNDYLSKPVLITDLRGAIERSVPQPESPLQLAAAPTQIAGGTPRDLADLFDEALIAEAIEALSDDPVEAADMLISLYRAEIPPQIEALVLAVGDRDRERMRYLAHKLTGGCWQIGARGLATRCAALERGALAEPQEALVRHVASIRSCNEATLRLLVARYGA
jgi:CheY-like chemotaxis protein/HPt (histidine-containing phosphotransfer) domain-containing protein